MSDPSTAGFEAESAQVESMLQIQCGYYLSEPDPLRRYLDLTHAQVHYEALVKSIRRERGKAVAAMIAEGTAIPEIATLTRLGTRQRVQTLARAGRPEPPNPDEPGAEGTPSPRKRAPSRRGVNGQVGEGNVDGRAGDGDQLQSAVGDVPSDDHAGGI
jgi:hypothetical protein